MSLENAEQHTNFLKRSFELAARGIGLVSPNPLVGCVIVASNGQIVGEGTYTYDAVVHAEAVALKMAGEQARGATAYISLEPHDHHSKTPPCTDALIEAGIRRVVCPIVDPNPLVSGRGFEALRRKGIEVVTGLLADEAARLNEKFICWHTKGRPFVHLKMAVSLDGRISIGKSVSTALSSKVARRRVHELRQEHDAILVGARTVAVDDPQLTDRSGGLRRRPLKRVILDSGFRLDPDSRLVKTAQLAPTVVIGNSSNQSKAQELRDAGITALELENGPQDLTAVLAELKRFSIQSVLVEGGAEVAGSFIDARLVDKITLIVAPLLIGGKDAPAAIGGTGALGVNEAVKLREIEITRLGEDIEITGYPE